MLLSQNTYSLLNHAWKLICAAFSHYIQCTENEYGSNICMHQIVLVSHTILFWYLGKDILPGFQIYLGRLQKKLSLWFWKGNQIIFTLIMNPYFMEETLFFYNLALSSFLFNEVSQQTNPSKCVTPLFCFLYCIYSCKNSSKVGHFKLHSNLDRK